MAKQVISKAGLEVVSFERGAAPTRTAYRFRLSEFEPARRASVERSLRAEWKGAEKVALDSFGRATVVFTGDGTDAREAVSASLKQRGLAAEDFETKRWPKLDATYVISVPATQDVDSARKVADALAGVAKVVAVHVYHDTGTATLWLKEPCNALEANVKAALASAGFTLARFELLAS